MNELYIKMKPALSCGNCDDFFLKENFLDYEMSLIGFIHRKHIINFDKFNNILVVFFRNGFYNFFDLNFNVLQSGNIYDGKVIIKNKQFFLFIIEELKYNIQSDFLLLVFNYYEMEGNKQFFYEKDMLNIFLVLYPSFNYEEGFSKKKVQYIFELNYCFKYFTNIYRVQSRFSLVKEVNPNIKFDDEK